MKKIKALILRDIISGEMRSAMKKLDQFQGSSKGVRLTKHIVSERMAGNKSHYITDANPLVSSVLEVYQEYWRQVLLKKQKPQSAEKILAKNLRLTLHMHEVDTQRKRNINQLESILSIALKKRGYECLTGIVQPFREFMIWKKQYLSVILLAQKV